MRVRALCALAVSLACVWASSAEANELVEITLPARKGELSNKWLGYQNPPKANVLLPDGYDPSKRYPLLVLLAGASSNYATWAGPAAGRIETTAAGFKGIIVMPEGATGMYTDWWNGGEFGDPAWESYYVDEVLPQIVDRYPIRKARRWHALAGVSMGGLGTAYLAGRMPGFFGSIALISGVPNIHMYPEGSSLVSLLPQAYAGDVYDLEAIWGPAEGFYAWGHDPVALAANLRQTRVFMSRGNGVPTDDGEPNGNNLATDIPAEVGLVAPASDNFANALAAAGVDYRYDVHDGIHDFANFRPEFRDAIAWGLFRPVVEHPRKWVNDTVASRGKLWDVGYRFDAPPKAIVHFARSGNRLSVSAAGTPVTLRTSDGCRIHRATPAIVHLADARC